MSATVTAPAGISEGDLLVAGLVVEGVLSVGDITAAGWNLISKTANQVTLATYWKIASDSEPANYTFDFKSSKRYAAGVSRISGADESQVETHAGSTGSGTALTSPSITTSVDDCLIMVFFGKRDNGGYSSPASPVYTNINSNPNGPSIMMDAFEKAAAGFSAGIAATSASSKPWVSQQIAIRPASDDDDNGDNGEPRPRPRRRPQAEIEEEPPPPQAPAGFRGRHEMHSNLIWIFLSWYPEYADAQLAGSMDIEKHRIYVSTGMKHEPEAGALTDGSLLDFQKLVELPADVLEYHHYGITKYVKYYYLITCVDGRGKESNLTSRIFWFVAGTDIYGELEAIPWAGSAEEFQPQSGSSCFIATAAYGSFESSEVVSLRTFRDGLLLSNRFGRNFTDAYYKASPAFADVIEGNSALRFIARMHLAPFVRAANLALNIN